jgi:hypothetical protein
MGSYWAKTIVSAMYVMWAVDKEKLKEGFYSVGPK